MSTDRIESKPTEGLSYSPVEAKYWERAGLAKELERVYDICQGCRLCFNLCPSLPALFDAIDKEGEDVRNLTDEQTWRVIDLCYGWKLCEVKCPYTPRDGHEFQLDFPRLMMRAKGSPRQGTGNRSAREGARKSRSARKNRRPSSRAG
jgi:glycerol-3-phosphate dehydrogenase subunit C